MVGDPVREQMVTAALALAATMTLDVVAEGVETEAVRRRLVDLGCTRGQGWLFSRALPAADVPAALARSARQPGAPLPTPRTSAAPALSARPRLSIVRGGARGQAEPDLGGASG